MGGHRERNWPAPPCPQCGEPDAARMGSTEWGHNFSCCSNECGFAFAKSAKRRELEHRNALMALSAAEQHVQRWGPLPDRAGELAAEVDRLRKEAADSLALLGRGVDLFAELPKQAPRVDGAWTVGDDGERFCAIGPWRASEAEAQADADHASMRGALPASVPTTDQVITAICVMLRDRAAKHRDPSDPYPTSGTYAAATFAEALADDVACNEWHAYLRPAKDGAR